MSIYLLRMSLLAILIGFAPSAAHAQLNERAAKFFADHIAPHLAVEGKEAIEKKVKCWRDSRNCEPGMDTGAGAQFRDLSPSEQAALMRRAFPAPGPEQQ
jgi:hypothetical protein